MSLLLGLELQRAGLAFLEVKARHTRDGGVRVDEIVCASGEDAALIDAWAAQKGLRAIVRVATAEELAEYKRFDL